MVQVIQSSNLELYEVEERFNLQLTQNPQLFQEWQGNLPELSAFEKQVLDKVKEDFLSITKYPLSEEIVKIAVLGQLLSLAELTKYPFYPVTEAAVEISFTDEDRVIRGRIDVLVLNQALWAVVVEAKRHSLNVDQGLAQALLHMVSNPNSSNPTFALILNGTEFLFVKLIPQEPPQYALSRLFSLRLPGNELYEVVGVLKRLREIALQ